MLFGRDDTTRQTPIEMSDDIRSFAHVIDDTKQYQTLRDRAAEDTSNFRGRSIISYIFSVVCNVNTNSKHKHVNTNITFIYLQTKQVKETVLKQYV